MSFLCSLTGYGVSKVASPLSTVVSHGYAAAPAYGGYGKFMFTSKEKNDNL